MYILNQDENIWPLWFSVTEPHCRAIELVFKRLVTLLSTKYSADSWARHIAIGQSLKNLLPSRGKDLLIKKEGNL